MHEVNTNFGALAEAPSDNRIGKAQEDSFPTEATTERFAELIGAAEPQNQRIEEIAINILLHKDRVAQSFLEIGNLLMEAKVLLTKHGQWMNWLDAEVNISYRMAERYMQLARTYANSTSVTNLGMTKALALLALPDADRETFMEKSHEINGKQKKVNEMSVRELRQVIHREIGTIAKEQKPVMLEVMTKDKIAYREVSRNLEAAQKLLDNIAKFLAKPPKDTSMPEKFSIGLRALCESAQKCMVLANPEPRSN